ncbi:MAG TPA: hypothetical protein VM282_27865 [Acidimicrobiales bacterium]|nr:hypothetical protein [Acidimicrobiales bacterium]
MSMTVLGELRRYCAFGFVLESSLALDLPPATAEPDVRLHLEFVSTEALQSGGPGRVLTNHRKYRLRMLCDGSLVFGNLSSAQFVFRRDDPIIRCHVHRDADMGQVERVLVDSVMPRWINLHGDLVLHASAVVGPDGRAAIFMGPSGWGKSTLAAGLALRGWPQLCDDAARIVAGDEMGVVPSYPAIRLFPPSFEHVGLTPDQGSPVRRDSAKRQFGPVGGRNFTRTPAPIGHIFTLVRPGESTALHIEPMGLADGLASILSSSFTAPQSEGRVGSRVFELSCALIAQASVYRLEYPRTMEILPRVHEMVDRVVRRQGKPAA